jgi:hypothetical protein
VLEAVKSEAGAGKGSAGSVAVTALGVTSNAALALYVERAQREATASETAINFVDATVFIK